MNENCLVTTLKGTVANDNLPKLNTIRFDYPGGYVTGEPTAVLGLTVKTGNSPVTIKFKSAIMHEDNYSGSIVTEMTIPANTTKYFATKLSDIGTGRINNFTEISGGIYDLVKLCPNGYPDYSILDCNPLEKVDINSVKYMDGLIAFGGVGMDYSKLPSSLKLLVVQKNTEKTDNIINIDNIPSGVQRVDAGRLNSTSQGSQYIELTENTRYLTGFKIAKGRLSGNIANMPPTTKFVKNSISLTGAVEDFVATANSMGVTNGCVAFEGNTIWKITYDNGTGAKAIISNDLSLPYVNGFYYMSWNGTTITWETSQPTGMQDWINAANSTVANYTPVS